MLEVATEYGLLKIFEPAVRPRVEAFGRRIEPIKGKARLIGPGPALKDEYERFQRLFEAHRKAEVKAKRQVA